MKRATAVGLAAVTLLAIGQTAATAQPIGSRAAPTAAKVTHTNTPMRMGISDSGFAGCDRGALTATGTLKPRQLHAARSSFVDQFWAPLRVATARVIVPWDIAYQPRVKADQKLLRAQDCLSAWLIAAKKAGVNPDITFAADKDYHVRAVGGKNGPVESSGSPKKVYAPDALRFKEAMIAFRDMYVSCKDSKSTCAGAPVRIVAAWNEPNAPGAKIYTPNGSRRISDVSCPKNPTTYDCGPMLTGQMWNIAYRRMVTNSGETITPKVTVVAGEFSGGGGLSKPGQPSYLAEYNKYLANLTGKRSRPYPGTWGLHDYEDVIRYETAYAKAGKNNKPPATGAKAPRAAIVANFAKALAALHPTHYTSKNTWIWLDEVSVFKGASVNKNKRKSWSTKNQTAAAKYLLATVPTAVPKKAPQVTRFYYLRYFDTFAWRSLVVGNKRAKRHTGFDKKTRRVPAYSVFANRHRTT